MDLAKKQDQDVCGGQKRPWNVWGLSEAACLSSDLQMVHRQRFGEGEVKRETEGETGGQGLFASGFKLFPSLQQIPSSVRAVTTFPIPPPPPSWSARWRGDWWVVPAGIMTRCTTCQNVGPLTPGQG